ncbi:endonuclease/exonuclease/phosphatase family protein [Paenibacillaceae bacterium WGS1546]|uniref:endonuclease/exonuclease/phosphatase family protein n=1 Tax=Cohnella sp. WGS1546 TaxID=3366810 RepID=UPI00372D7F5B
MKVMSFNLRYDNPEDGADAWPNRAHRVADAVRKADPTLIGTQEGLLHMLEDLRDRLPGYAWLGEGREGGVRGEHNAIFYKQAEFEALDSGQFWLSEDPSAPGSKGWDGYCPRICTWAHFRSLRCPGAEGLIYNTHLDFAGRIARERGAALIWRAMKAHVARTSLPAILTGDFNAYPDSAPIRFLRGETASDGERPNLRDAYTLLGPNAIGCTAHEFNGGVGGQPPIDYIFATPDVELVSVEIERGRFDGAYPSDHYPVVAVVRLPRGSAGRA